MRLHIGLFGRRNVGKSSLLNALTKQNIAIVSDCPGTTTDPVEKNMELQPIGPVTFIDTAGIDDEGSLGNLRIQKTFNVFSKTDFALIITNGIWDKDEIALQQEMQKRNIPWIAVLNQSDIFDYSQIKSNLIQQNARCVCTSALTGLGMEDLLQAIIGQMPPQFLESRPILADLVPLESTVLLVIPIDKEAPKGRLILPQVQTIRDLLDDNVNCVICRENGVAQMLQNLKTPPAMVVTDSQVFHIVSPQVPDDILLTGFSILFARFKGDLTSLAKGAAVLENLRPHDRVLIAEACTHHPIQDDIGRVKIPNWIRKKYGNDIQIDVISGTDFPDNLADYKLIIHCGACMWTRRQMLERIRMANAEHVAITNYGMAIAALHDILDRALKPFPEALEQWKNELQRA